MGQAPSPPRKAGGEEPDPSMDDILASIRRILDEEGAAKPPGSDVLMLDTSMMVDVPAAGDTTPPEPAKTEAAVDLPAPAPGGESTPPMTSTSNDASADPVARAAPGPLAEPPLSPAPPVSGAEAAAASSVGALMRTLAAERKAMVSRGGMTIEDIVREEIRPLLIAWLDAHLPPIVERAVRVEIERIVGQQAEQH